MSDSQYIDRRAAAKSYRPGGYMMSPGLMRAREPYRVKNLLTGLGITSFAVGVWLYSMSAVKQDNFDDVDEEARAMVRTGVKPIEEVVREQRVVERTAAATPKASVGGEGSGSGKAQGLLAPLDGVFPQLLDPEGKTVVWGAPPVDSVGRIGDSSRKTRRFV